MGIIIIIIIITTTTIIFIQGAHLTKSDISEALNTEIKLLLN